MARFITIEDFIDVYTKIKQRGTSFILSKFNLNNKARVISAFDTDKTNTSHWWDIPYIHKRWNKMISNNETIDYKDYLIQSLLQNKKNLKVLSLGSGECYNELYYAQFPEIFESITCVDITENNLIKAQRTANSQSLKNIFFKCVDLYKFDFEKNHYDLIMFHASLHHFKNLDSLFSKKLIPSLKPDGLLFINEYVGVNRLQFPNHQIKEINRALKIIPEKYRKRKATELIKNKYYGSGWLRMYISDPSEAVESETILPVIHKYFNIIEEKSFGGNILMSVFKDIAYHFNEETSEKKAILNSLFKLEDEYLKTYPSDFLIGLYQRK